MVVSVALDRVVIVRAMKVALVAGSALNLINQGGKLVNLGFEELNYLKLSLTYFTPYVVSTFTAVHMQISSPTMSQQALRE